MEHGIMKLAPVSVSTPRTAPSELRRRPTWTAHLQGAHLETHRPREWFSPGKTKRCENLWDMMGYDGIWWDMLGYVDLVDGIWLKIMDTLDGFQLNMTIPVIWYPNFEPLPCGFSWFSMKYKRSSEISIEESTKNRIFGIGLLPDWLCPANHILYICTSHGCTGAN